MKQGYAPETSLQWQLPNFYPDRLPFKCPPLVKTQMLEHQSFFVHVFKRKSLVLSLLVFRLKIFPPSMAIGTGSHQYLFSRHSNGSHCDIKSTANQAANQSSAIGSLLQQILLLYFAHYAFALLKSEQP